MELVSQRVWDYAGDGYVHRLLHNARDGKLVEFPDPRGPGCVGVRTHAPCVCSFVFVPVFVRVRVGTFGSTSSSSQLNF